MNSVHLRIEEGAELSVSFPQMNTADGEITTGTIVRVFGSPVDLAKLLGDQKFASFHAGGMFRLGRESIRAVPHTSNWEVYKRDRSRERSFTGFRAREARYVERNPDAKWRLDRPKERHEKMAFIHMRSASTGGRRFSLFIRKAIVEGFVVGKPNTYGMGVPVPAF
jgi:CRISPR-associated endoribonuclease Cas6/Csy4 subtype I-F